MRSRRRGRGRLLPALDCDDDAPAAHPGAPESCNQRDDNCDGAVDEVTPDDAPTWFPDGDGDGFGAAAPAWVGCAAPAGWVADSADCDDDAPAVNPGAAEVCGNGVDDDCDTLPGDCRLTGTLSAAEADYLLVGGWNSGTGLQADVGDAEESGLGNDLAIADLDGDGRGDLVVGSAWGGDGTGAVPAWFGPMTGIVDALAASADLSVAGAGPWGHFGVAVGVDDVDGDGQDDLAVASNALVDGVDSRGFLLLYCGPFGPGALNVDDADLVIHGVEDDGWLGYGEPRAADLDGDGVPELVVAAPLADLQGLGSDSGAFYVFRGQGL